LAIPNEWYSLGSQEALQAHPSPNLCKIGIEGSPPSDVDKQAGIQKRQEIFKANKALERLEMRYLDSSLLVHLLVVGNEGVIIAFGMKAGDLSIKEW